VATVGAGGAITGITITNPGSGYETASVSIDPIQGTGSGAAADAVINTTGSVTTVSVDQGGAGYTTPVVSFTGGTPTTPAAAIAYGGVDAVILGNPGSGYTNPIVDFDLPDGADGVKAVAHAQFDQTTGAITAVFVDHAGSGYSFAPHVVIRDGTIFDPIPNGGTGATATSTLAVQTVALTDFGSGYTAAPTADITDSTGTGTGAMATATTDVGAIIAINVTAAGSGYLIPGIRKFVDGLPGVTEAAKNNLDQYLPIAVADQTTFTAANGFEQDADYYVIALVQHREKMHSDLPPTLLREYVQLETNVASGKHIALQTDLLDGTSTATLMPNGDQAYAVDDPHFLGPLIVAQKDKSVRIVFYNLLPTGNEGICSCLRIPRLWVRALDLTTHRLNL
jgi:hypothetical protein